MISGSKETQDSHFSIGWTLEMVKKLILKNAPDPSFGNNASNTLDLQERMYYEYTIAEGTVVHKLTSDPLNTISEVKHAKWIFVMSATKRLFAAEKKKGFSTIPAS